MAPWLGEREWEKSSHQSWKIYIAYKINIFMVIHFAAHKISGYLDIGGEEFEEEREVINMLGHF